MDARDPHEIARLNQAANAGAALLVWRDDAGTLRILQLHGPAHWIGRSPHASVPITWDRKVSGTHAQLTVAGAACFLEDADSANGTWVGGQRITSKVRLADGDRIRAGACVMVFRAPSVAATITSTVVATDVGDLPDFDETDRRILVELCRRFVQDDAPVTVPNKAIAAALSYGEDAIARRLGNMYKRAGLNHLEDGDKRVELARLAVQFGVVSPRDYRGRGDGRGR